MGIRSKLRALTDSEKISVQSRIDKHLVEQVDQQIEQDRANGLRVDRTILIIEAFKNYVLESRQQSKGQSWLKAITKK
jgi:hypothetical protein